jgi:antibiotic biosynthesis monooxygenase (ABM) superfamily enzyme
MAEPLAFVSSWTASAGHEDEVAALGREALHAAARFEGHLDGMVVHDEGSPVFHFVHTYRSADELQRWMDSPERKALVAAMSKIATRHGEPQRITGLEGWFVANRDAVPTIKPPPRWKMWLASFMGAYPLVVLFQWLAAPVLEDVPLLLRAALLPLTLLSLMTYVVMPFVTRLLHRWLYPQGEHGRSATREGSAGGGDPAAAPPVAGA